MELLTEHPYGPAPYGYPRQESNAVLDYVDMVAGRKARDQIQTLANSGSKFFFSIDVLFVNRARFLEFFR